MILAVTLKRAQRFTLKTIFYITSNRIFLIDPEIKSTHISFPRFDKLWLYIFVRLNDAIGCYFWITYINIASYILSLITTIYIYIVHIFAIVNEYQKINRVIEQHKINFLLFVKLLILSKSFSLKKNCNEVRWLRFRNVSPLFIFLVVCFILVDR